jgi:polar amino acid transport system ATP-binding protein
VLSTLGFLGGGVLAFVVALCRISNVHIVRVGFGKSTALRCIDQLERIDACEIVVYGHLVSDPGLALRKLRLDVGMVFQSYNLFPHLTMLQNVTLTPRVVKRLGRPEAEALVERVLG